MPASPSSSPLPAATPLVTLDEATARLAAESAVAIEVAGDAGEPSPPASLRLTLDDVSGEEGPRTGARPLPKHGPLVRRLASAGLTPPTPVVLVARTPRDLAAAARAWVTLRWAGLRDVSFLNGAHSDDLAALPRPATLPATDASAFTRDHAVVAVRSEVAGRDEASVLVDARTPEAYGGDHAHIPGAVNVPTRLLARDGRILDPGAVRAAYAETIGIDPAERPLVLSCGSGVAASVQALALASIGVAAPVYVGSWSEWSKTSGRT
ncbi:rhodanese-like domain-containing protein [Microbacterium betulae]|uniref:thiosulfate sulfurtransferase n=1 Tax=Microbacterium betulae TaxID=2981139 RepID=A0AA97I6S6_9MICO|nr:rhodanese-like domain-containing protein [Microbacterium sp. AB]WOF23472.1 rhodanese-like domain-containing protein [Microbacterium sp. AB]